MHDPHIWGWEIPVYLFLGGLSAGLMIIAALVPKKEWMAVRLLPFAAAGILSAGMFALFLDLHRDDVDARPENGDPSRQKGADVLK